MRVGLTGNVASGKSAVADVWREAGVPVLDADILARRVVEQGTPGLAEVVEVFGSGVLAPDGTLDRVALRNQVFSDPVARARLEAILHPRIARLRDEWVRDQEAAGAPLTVAEIPLLFEAGLERTVDRIVLVDAPEPLRLGRLVEHRKLEPEVARAMMDAQMDPAGKRVRSHHVLENTGNLADLRRSALDLLTLLRAGPGDGPRGLDERASP